MTEQQAREILGTRIGDDGVSLDWKPNLGSYYQYFPGSNTMTLDGDFNADELEAFAWWMRKHA